MRMRWLSGAALAMACAAAVPALAQDAATQSASMPKITVTGCVERADQVLSRETLGTSIDSQMFVLIKAQEGAAQNAAARPADSGISPDADKTYRLDVAADTVNPHVGHRVEVVGSIARPAADAAVGTSGRAPAGDPAGAMPPPMLKVESVKMLSSTCAR